MNGDTIPQLSGTGQDVRARPSARRRFSPLVPRGVVFPRPVRKQLLSGSRTDPHPLSYALNVVVSPEDMRLNPAVTPGAGRSLAWVRVARRPQGHRPATLGLRVTLPSATLAQTQGPMRLSRGGGGRALVCHTPPATPLPTFLGLPCRARCWGTGGSRSSSAPDAATRQSQRAHVRGGPVPQTRETLTVIKD